MSDIALFSNVLSVVVLENLSSFDRTSSHEISTSIWRKYLFPCCILRFRTFSDIESFRGFSPAHSTKCVAFWKAAMSLPIFGKNKHRTEFLNARYIRHALKSNLSIYEIIQILGVPIFDKTPIRELLTEFQSNKNSTETQ